VVDATVVLVVVGAVVVVAVDAVVAVVAAGGADCFAPHAVTNATDVTVTATASSLREPTSARRIVAPFVTRERCLEGALCGTLRTVPKVPTRRDRVVAAGGQVPKR
jgi:hypothetical protein